ncbi:MAG: hypothetical protein AAFX93_11925 [Verrucomicrobiota bacterium]
MTAWLWIGGWGFSKEEIQNLVNEQVPGVQHFVICPGPEWLDELHRVVATQPIRRLLGYSLGSFLILRDLEKLPDIPTVLFSPIVSFKAEENLGGRFDGRRLKVLVRWLQRDPRAALSDFRKQVGIPPMDSDMELPCSVEQLVWGIKQLDDEPVEVPAETADISMIIGEQDAVTDARFIENQWAKTKVVTGVGHDLRDLVKEVACVAV